MHVFEGVADTKDIPLCATCVMRSEGGVMDRTPNTNVVLLVKSLIVRSLVLFTNPSAREGYDTRSIFKRSLTGLNSEFSFS